MAVFFLVTTVTTLVTSGDNGLSPPKTQSVSTFSPSGDNPTNLNI